MCEWVLTFWWHSAILSQALYLGDRTVRQASDYWQDDVQWTRTRVRVMRDDVVSRRHAPSISSSICKCCSLTSLTQHVVQSTHSVHGSSIPQNPLPSLEGQDTFDMVHLICGPLDACGSHDILRVNARSGQRKNTQSCSVQAMRYVP